MTDYKKLRGNRSKTYYYFVFPLDNARINQEIEIQGEYIYAETFDGTTAFVTLNELENDQIPIRQHRGIVGSFYRFFLNNPATASKNLKVVISNDPNFSIQDWS